ncbi:MAG: hypothetical protein K5872_18230 [Rhizobiaceae bacterium]|nr:hypothetical protein [Rhizobiaceae bacterium]MCV0408163.1 hypothetical protein [Rhizobiaceae bacterium]
MATGTKSSIEDNISSVVRSHIRSGDVVNVIVEHSDDPDGIIIVKIIFDAKNNKLDVKETSQLSRHVWKRLIELGEPGFPSLSFIAKSEAGKLAAA